jgi:hypothetical protein
VQRRLACADLLGLDWNRIQLLANLDAVGIGLPMSHGLGIIGLMANQTILIIMKIMQQLGFVLPKQFLDIGATLGLHPQQ